LQNQGVGASPYNPVEPGRFSAPPNDVGACPYNPLLWVIGLALSVELEAHKIET